MVGERGKEGETGERGREKEGERGERDNVLFQSFLRQQSPGFVLSRGSKLGVGSCLA